MSFESELSVFVEAGATGFDEEIGSVDEIGWYGLLLTVDGFPDGPRHGIISEDRQGFKHLTTYPTVEAARAEWALLEKLYEDLWDNNENES